MFLFPEVVISSSTDRIGPSFLRWGLDTSGALGDSDVVNQLPQIGVLAPGAGGQSVSLRAVHSVHHCTVRLKLNCRGSTSLAAGGLCHQQPDQFIREQVNPQLLHHHLRRATAQPVHAEGHLDVTKIQRSTFQRR